MTTDILTNSRTTGVTEFVSRVCYGCH